MLLGEWFKVSFLGFQVQKLLKCFQVICFLSFLWCLQVHLEPLLTSSKRWNWWLNWLQQSFIALIQQIHEKTPYSRRGGDYSGDHTSKVGKTFVSNFYVKCFWTKINNWYLNIFMIELQNTPSKKYKKNIRFEVHAKSQIFSSFFQTFSPSC